MGASNSSDDLFPNHDLRELSQLLSSRYILLQSSGAPGSLVARVQTALTTPKHACHRLRRQAGGFHVWDFLLGVLLTVAMTGFLYYRVRNTGLKALNRERQSFAVKVSLAMHQPCMGFADL